MPSRREKVGVSGYTFCVPGNPLSQNAVYRRGRGKHIYMTQEGKAWIEAIQLVARLSTPDGWDLTGQKEVQLIHYFDSARPDCDGPVKLELDSLQKIAYLNDRQVRDFTARKRLDRDNPRLEVSVWNAL